MITAPEITSIIGGVSILAGQVYLFYKAQLSDKRKAEETHVQSIETAAKVTHDEAIYERTRRDEEMNRFRERIKLLEDKLETTRDLHSKCEIELAAVKTRLSVLEEFRKVVVSDEPTGATKLAIPPPPSVTETPTKKKSHL